MVSFKLKAIQPKGLPTGEEYARAIEKSVQKSAGLVLKDLEATVRTWVHKPVFDVTITQERGDYGVVAGTDDAIWGYVNKGTKKHAIRPKRSKYLHFSSGYKAKTRPNIIGSVEGGAFGNDVFSKGVLHPGFVGRHFDKAIAKRRQITVQQEVRQAIAIVARKQGK